MINIEMGLEDGDGGARNADVDDGSRHDSYSLIAVHGKYGASFNKNYTKDKKISSSVVSEGYSHGNISYTLNSGCFGELFMIMINNK